MDIDRIIGLYLRGQATEKQLETLRHWMSASEKNAGIVRNMEKVWALKSQKRIFINEREVSDRVWMRLEKEKQKGQLWKLPIFYKIAASFALMAAFAFLFLYFANDYHQSVPVAAEKTIIKSNPAGTKSTIRLPDGSTVILNAESSISYSFSQKDTVRALHLTGEAYFKVQRDPYRPFIVISGNTNTRALGTEFSIKAYPDEETIDIALTEGEILVKVKSTSLHREFHLGPGEGVFYDKRANSARKGIFDPMKSIVWKDGTLYFDREGFDEVIKALSRWYGVEFTVRNYNGEQWHYSGEFSNEYLDVVLQSMAYAKHFDFEITDGKVIIDFKPKHQSDMKK